jgi:hypothetical protein
MNWKHKSVTIAAAVLAIGLMPAGARAEGRKIKAEIPFAFHAGNHSLPAGAYLFEQMDGRPMLMITPPSGDRFAVLTHPAGKTEESSAPGLVFEQDEAGYRLTEVWARGSAQTAGLSQGKRAALVAGGRARVRIVASLAIK